MSIFVSVIEGSMSEQTTDMW